MTIAVHISFTQGEDLSKNFNFRCFTTLAAQYPEDHFIFIFDKAFDQSLINQKNITAIILSPQIKNRLLAHYWYNYKLPRLLNKVNATVFISNGTICSLRSTAKQCMVLHDLSFFQKDNLFSKSDSRYIKKYLGQFIAKASGIVVTNDHVKNSLNERFPQSKNKTHVIGYGINDASTFSDHEKIQVIKEKITEGKEYFLCYITAASQSNTTMLLKAFSAFKKRQLSNMQLVLLLASTQTENPVKDFTSYKYRNEVKIINPGADLSLEEITAAAYAAIYLPAMDVLEDNGLTALKNNIPLITTDNDFCKGIYADAALYTQIDERNIAEQMMLMYKDENGRNILVNKGKQLAEAFSWNNTANRLRQALIA